MVHLVFAVPWLTLGGSAGSIPALYLGLPIPHKRVERLVRRSWSACRFHFLYHLLLVHFGRLGDEPLLGPWMFRDGACAMTVSLHNALPFLC